MSVALCKKKFFGNEAVYSIHLYYMVYDAYHIACKIELTILYALIEYYAKIFSKTSEFTSKIYYLYKR